MDLNVSDGLHFIEDIIPIDAQIVSSLTSGSLIPFGLLSPFDMNNL